MYESLQSSEICKNTLLFLSLGFLWFFWTWFGCTSGYGLGWGLTYMSLILGPNLKGQQQVTRESDSHGEWQECKKSRQIIQTYLKFLVWQHGLCLPIFLWSKQIIWPCPKSVEQWSVFYKQWSIALTGKEGRIVDKILFTTTSKNIFYFFSMQMLTAHNLYSTFST